MKNKSCIRQIYATTFIITLFVIIGIISSCDNFEGSYTWSKEVNGDGYELKGYKFDTYWDVEVKDNCEEIKVTYLVPGESIILNFTKNGERDDLLSTDANPTWFDTHLELSYDGMEMSLVGTDSEGKRVTILTFTKIFK